MEKRAAPSLLYFSKASTIVSCLSLTLKSIRRQNNKYCFLESKIEVAVAENGYVQSFYYTMSSTSSYS